MQRTIKFEVTNIRDYLNVDLDEAGEIILKQILSGFSCALNPDIENFLKRNAINFAKKNQSVTYLVFRELTLVGYFTLAMKPITVCADGLSNTVKRKLERVGEYDKATNTYKLAAYLIAQLGKNYTNGNNQYIWQASHSSSHHGQKVFCITFSLYRSFVQKYTIVSKRLVSDHLRWACQSRGRGTPVHSNTMSYLFGPVFLLKCTM